MLGSQSTREHSCCDRSGMISCGGVPAATFCPVAFMYTSHLGGFILEAMLSKAAFNFFCAGFINSVWNPPDVLISLACIAFSFSAASLNLSTAGLVPAQAKPFLNKTFAIWQTSTSPGAACFARSQSSATTSSVRPAMDTMACGVEAAASAIAAPLIMTSFRASSNSRTPAAQRAQYSPSERPATACGLSAASGRVSRKTSRAAMPAKNKAGWHTLVSSSFSLGPWRHTSNKS
mmetsp:Transcript_33233/g.77503  ORF Transcript_33233/g.77503 Transcript_33233/m.77503 type:complete len:233 (-) Transcript_33233:1403-2101(-)